MAFDLHEGHHHFKFASRILLTKFYLFFLYSPVLGAGWGEKAKRAGKTGAYLGGALGARAPRGHQRGAKKKEKRKEKERERGEKRKKEEKKGIRKKKGKKEGARKKKERKLNQYDERGAKQFQVQAGVPGKKTSGAPN